MSPAPTPSAPLTPEYTFVVQVQAGTQIEAGQTRGRVEHVVSRHATTFQSVPALLAFMAQVLREREASRRTERYPLAQGRALEQRRLRQKEAQS